MLELTDVGPASPIQVQSEWDEEIQRRLEELRSGQVAGVPLEEVKKRMEARFRSCRRARAYEAWILDETDEKRITTRCSEPRDKTSDG